MRKNLYADLYTLEESHWWHRAKRTLCLSFIQKVSQGKKTKILDIGCGTGGNIKAFSQFGTTYGIDNSKSAIEFCTKRRLKRVKIGSAYASGMPASFFDVVTLLDVLEHIEEKKALREIKRVLKPGGTLIITVPAYQLLWSEWDVVLHHKRRYNKTQLTGLLTTEGFVINKCSYLYSFLFLPVLLIRSLKMLVKKKEYTSDFTINAKPINNFLLFLATIEQRILMARQIPFGTSIICIANRP